MAEGLEAVGFLCYFEGLEVDLLLKLVKVERQQVLMDLDQVGCLDSVRCPDLVEGNLLQEGKPRLGQEAVFNFVVVHEQV